MDKKRNFWNELSIFFLNINTNNGNSDMSEMATVIKIDGKINTSNGELATAIRER